MLCKCLCCQAHTVISVQLADLFTAERHISHNFNLNSIGLNKRHKSSCHIRLLCAPPANSTGNSQLQLLVNSPNSLTMSRKRRQSTSNPHLLGRPLLLESLSSWMSTLTEACQTTREKLAANKCRLLQAGILCFLQRPFPTRRIPHSAVLTFGESNIIASHTSSGRSYTSLSA